MTIDRRTFLRALPAGLAACALSRRAVAAGAGAGARKPNIVFILTDDQGWGDGTRFGHPYMRTPSIDRLAREGAWFKQFYVANPVCSPSRTAFMTGHYPARHRVHRHFSRPQNHKAWGMPDWLDPDATTVCDLLKTAGYATAHFGKWHLCGGGVKEAPAPTDYGIDDYRVCGPMHMKGWAPETRRDPFFRAKSTGYFVDEAIRFIKANRGTPFYINLWTLVPHATLNPTPEELAVYKGLEVAPGDFPGYMRQYVKDAKDTTSQMRVFCASMTGLDKAIGRLLAFLDREGLADDTIVLFSSDNGPEDYHIGNARNAGMGSPGPLRARKRSIYEGGVRTPLIVRWPGKVEAGRVDDTSVVASVDFLPTVCRLAGVPLPGRLAPDGEDVSDVLLKGPRPRTRPVFWEWRGPVAGNPAYEPPRLAIREGKWKLFANPDGASVQLYDVPADPGERTNLASKHPDVARRLTAKLLAWKKALPE